MEDQERQGQELGERTVASAMQPEFVSVESNDQLDFVDDIMQLGRVRHMPVVDDGELVGVVSQRDLLAAALSRALDFDPAQRRTFLRSVLVGEVMTAKPITISPDATLLEAARTLLAHKIGCLPVVDADGRPVGILTESDLVRGAYRL